MKNRWLYILITVPFIMGLVFGSLYDFQINSALFSDPTKNVFGLIFSAFVPSISYAYMAFLGGYSFEFALKERRTLIKVLLIVAAAALVGVAIYFPGDRYASVNAFNNKALLVPGYISALVIEGGLAVLGYFVAKKTNNKNFLLASLVMVVAIAIALVPAEQILKNVFRRPRFRTLGVIDGARYMNWWEPFKDYESMKALSSDPDFSEHFKSFPSGHTCEAAMLVFELPMLAMLFPKLKGKEHWLTLAGVVFALLMGLSRMTMGAHYLSDISMGALIMIVLLIIANEINLRFFIKE